MATSVSHALSRHPREAKPPPNKWDVYLYLFENVLPLGVSVHKHLQKSTVDVVWNDEGTLQAITDFWEECLSRQRMLVELKSYLRSHDAYIKAVQQGEVPNTSVVVSTLESKLPPEGLAIGILNLKTLIFMEHPSDTQRA